MNPPIANGTQGNICAYAQAPAGGGLLDGFVVNVTFAGIGNVRKPLQSPAQLVVESSAASTVVNAGSALLVTGSTTGDSTGNSFPREWRNGGGAG